MKTFIFLLIAIVAFFSYIFMGNSKTRGKRETSHKYATSIPTPTLDMIEEENYTSQFQNSIEQSPVTTSQSTATLDIQTINKPDVPPISEHMTFDQLKNIILETNPYYPKSNITLNTPMSSILRTKEERETFQSKIENTFHLSTSDVAYYMQKNKLLWDWVNILK